MAFNVGTSKQQFNKLKALSLQKRMEAVRGPEAATILSMLTPTQFAELFPKYLHASLPDVSGFREAVSRRSRQKQDDINFGLSQGAKSIEEAEQMGSWRRRGQGGDQEKVSSPSGSSNVRGTFKAANYVALLKQAGFSDKDATLMAAVGMRESNGNTQAHNDGNPNRERSYGLFQININAHPFGSPEMKYAGVNSVEDLYDPVKNAKVAYYLYHKTGTGINHWGGYTDGGYKQYLPAAQAAAGTPAGMGPSMTGSSGAAPDFSQYALHKGIDNYKGECGVGTRQLAGRMFGKSYFFDNGLGSGGDAHAGSLSTGNKYFQSSGLYASGKPVGKEALSQEYLNSLPIGTVVSSQGGSRGGHVQIKIGPNQWASDTVQSGFFHGNSYGNFVVHEPNEAGLAILAKNGVMQPGEMPGQPATSVKVAEEGQQAVVAAQQTVAPAAPAPRQPEIPQETPDSGQTATVSKPGKQESAAKTFNVNRQALIGAIKQTDEFKNTFGSSLATDDMIYNGFFDDARTKKLMADTQSSFDPNTGTVKIGNYDAFKKSVGMDTSKILSEVASNVPSHAGGGREKVKGPLHMRHLHHQRRGDTALVTDARGKQFTVNPKKETMSVNPQTGIMDIKPVKAGEQMDIEKLMAIIRKQESGSFEGNYSADLAAKVKKKGQRHDTASGAYQFNNRTWQGVLNKELNMPQILKQYPRAVNAPKEVQDQVMRARIEKWRAAGHSDNEIILHHFTGNKEGKLSAAAQKGNPTPAQYRAQIASHASDYDRAYQSQPEPVKAEVAKAGPITTQPAPQNESMASKLAAPLKGLLGPTSAAAETVKAAPAPEAPKGEVSVGTAAMDENWFKKQEQAAQPKVEVPPDRPQSQINMNPIENRPAHMQPTPSLARAMDNARGIQNSDYTSLTGTKLGGK